jgi:hypothetical protein
MEPSLNEIERVKHLEQTCRLLMHHCLLVQQKWQRYAQLQKQLPATATTMNQAMLAVMAIPTADEDGKR